jgi:hypothetical protein
MAHFAKLDANTSFCNVGRQEDDGQEMALICSDGGCLQADLIQHQRRCS